MKVFGQGIIDSSERFLHSLYLSSGGNQFLDGNPIVESLGGGVIALSMFILAFLVSVLIGMYFVRHTRLPALPVTVESVK